MLLGNRLGMGGGFYDRTLSGWAQGRYPNLSVAGVAHDCQFVDTLPSCRLGRGPCNNYHPEQNLVVLEACFKSTT